MHYVPFLRTRLHGHQATFQRCALGTPTWAVVWLGELAGVQAVRVAPDLPDLVRVLDKVAQEASQGHSQGISLGHTDEYRL